MHTKFAIALLFIGVWNFSFAQEDNAVVLEQIIEEIAQSSDADIDYSELFDDLQAYLEQPLNLNDATQEDLLKFQFLTYFQISQILDYVNKKDGFLTIYELQLIESMSMEDIYRLLPFVEIKPPKNSVKDDLQEITKRIKYGKHQLYARTQFVVQEQQGYVPVPDSVLADNPDKSRYLGNKYKYYLRYKYKYKEKILMGATLEKDPGEQFFSGHQQYGFDYYSAHIQLQNIGPFKTIVLGDYSAQSGQGLVVWNSMARGKSAYVMNVRKRPRLIRKYSSVDENNFYRGAAFVFNYGGLDVSSFFSYKNIDANITNLDTVSDEVREVSSLLLDGFHNTPSRIADDNALGEFVAGAVAKYEYKNFQVGMSGLYSKYSAPLQKTINPANQFDFMGTENMVAGADYQLSFTHSSFFGEFAMSRNGGWAYLNGAQFHLAPQLSMAVLNRNYLASFQSLYAGAFAEGSKAQNEKGTYFGLEVHPYKYWKLSLYSDFYQFPWLRSQAVSPTGGREYFAQLEYQPARNVYTYTKFKTETKQENIASDELQGNLKSVSQYTKTSFRYHIEYTLNRVWVMKNRVEFSFYNKNETREKGFMVYQDVNFRPTNKPFNFSFRYAFVDATWETRLYAYENDILYAFSVPAYYGQSTRAYLVSKIDLSEKLTLWARYAISHFSDRTIVSSGLDEIAGPTKSDVKVQLRYSF